MKTLRLIFGTIRELIAHSVCCELPTPNGSPLGPLTPKCAPWCLTRRLREYPGQGPLLSGSCPKKNSRAPHQKKCPGDHLDNPESRAQRATGTRLPDGNASLFTKCLFTIFVPTRPPPPNQQDDGFPLEFLLEGP